MAGASIAPAPSAITISVAVNFPIREAKGVAVASVARILLVGPDIL